MFSRFQEMNYPKLFADCCQDLTAKEVTKVLPEYIKKMSWKTGDRVLDMGCGPGRVTTQVLLPRLPADFGLLVGADKSADMIQIASETYTNPKLRFTQFDLIKDIVDTSQLRPSDFDKIFTFFLLHWVSDNRYYLAINPGFHIFYCVLLNDIFMVLTQTFIYFSTFRGNVAPPKRRQLFATPPGVTSHKNSIFINTLWELQFSHYLLSFEITLSGVRPICKRR